LFICHASTPEVLQYCGGEPRVRMRGGSFLYLDSTFTHAFRSQTFSSDSTQAPCSALYVCYIIISHPLRPAPCHPSAHCSPSLRDKHIYHTIINSGTPVHSPFTLSFTQLSLIINHPSGLPLPVSLTRTPSCHDSLLSPFPFPAPRHPPSRALAAL